jgi:hypothetical protein
MEPNLERKKASDYPQELLNLFDKYVHGEIDRRAFLDGAQKFAVGGVTALRSGKVFGPITPLRNRCPRTTSVSRPIM